jgi:hypothetical protein
MDLGSCISKLSTREQDLSEKIGLLTGEAKHKSTTQDMAGAKRKLIERRRCQEQLVRVTNSICIIESHANAIEGTELNKEILNTIRASGDAIKKLNVQVTIVFMFFSFLAIFSCFCCFDIFVLFSCCLSPLKYVLS